MVKKNEINFLDRLKTKKATRIFAIISLISGLLFIAEGIITERVIFNSEYSLNPFSVIGILLVLFSIILGTYSLKKTEK